MSKLFDVPVTPEVADGVNEWYTPARYIEAARKVMGAIDLDPASCALANQVVRAMRIYTKEDDGLQQPWHGRVWLNPPYKAEVRTSVSLQALWVNKALAEYAQGNALQMILLVTGVTERKWFQPLWDFPICFPDHQIRFRMMDSSKFNHPYGTCFVYLGTNEARFVEVFTQFGRIAKAIDKRPAKAINLELWTQEVPA